MDVIRVLNGGTSPVLSFQKFSRWYNPHGGVSRFLIWGEFRSDILNDGCSVPGLAKEEVENIEILTLVSTYTHADRSL